MEVPQIAVVKTPSCGIVTSALATTTPATSAIRFTSSTDDDKIVPSDQATSGEAALRVLEPTSKSVDTIEAARVFNVFEQMLKQMKILLNVEKIRDFLDSELPLRELAQRCNIFGRIDTLIELKAMQVANPDDESIEERIQKEARNLCRSFRHSRELEKFIILMLDSEPVQH